ncbi:regulator of chromosome condensation-like [Watersipora subatra]|uniref:regulator of chromosome condensation-like n=1 Tax=Watersipora subatra TaxID=2589382 RepID=UPI00355AF0F7
MANKRSQKNVKSSNSKTSSIGVGKKRASPAVSSGGSPAKRPKVDHRSHSDTAGLVLAVGEGDVGQLGLGPDVMEKSRAGLVAIPSKCIQAVAGGMHTVCLTVNGDVFTFGCNDEGALGRDTSEDDSEMTPAIMNINTKFVQISAGDSHTAMLTNDGQVYACGTFRDANGSIGLTDKGPETRAVHLPCPKVIIKIVSGSDHILALSEDGFVFSAGCAEQGQLGRIAECFATRGGRKGLHHLLKLQQVHFQGTRTNRKPKFDDIWAGTYVSFAKSTNGDIYAWGLNNYYQLGTGDMENKYVPTLVSELPADKKWQCIAGGQHHTIALSKDGEVYSMGRGTYGQLGLGESSTNDVTELTKVASLTEKCSSVEASSSVSFALGTSGKAYGWGMGTCKQLSNGEEEDQFEPQPMVGKQLANKEVLTVSSGGQHTILLAREKPDSGDQAGSG